MITIHLTLRAEDGSPKQEILTQRETFEEAEEVTQKIKRIYNRHVLFVHRDTFDNNGMIDIVEMGATECK